MADRSVTYLPLDDIRGQDVNPKNHDTVGIADSIQTHGLGELPLLDERTGRIVAGHGRIDFLRAAQRAGRPAPADIRVADDGTWCVPVQAGWASRDDAHARAYVAASNRLTETGGWDLDVLPAYLADLDDQGLLPLTGWSAEDLAAMLDPGTGHDPEPDAGGGGDAGPGGPAGQPVTTPGDVWLLGEGRLICGDSRDFDVVEKVLDGVRVNIAFTSPPYASQRAYDQGSGFTPIRPDDYVDWFADVQANVRAVLADDGSWFVNIKEHCADGQRHLYVKDLTIAHVRQWGWRFVDELVWLDTSNGMPGSWPNRFKDAWEPVFHYSLNAGIKFRPLANGTPTDDLFVYDPDTHIAANDGQGGGYHESAKQRERTSGLARPSNVVPVPAGGQRGVEHSAAFPLALPAWFIRAYSDVDDVVLDPFAGSGTTLLAAHQQGRVGYGVELSPGYCDTICRRFQQATGVIPILESTGVPHDFTAGADPELVGH